MPLAPIITFFAGPIINNGTKFSTAERDIIADAFRLWFKPEPKVHAVATNAKHEEDSFKSSDTEVASFKSVLDPELVASNRQADRKTVKTPFRIQAYKKVVSFTMTEPCSHVQASIMEWRVSSTNARFSRLHCIEELPVLEEEEDELCEYLDYLEEQESYIDEEDEDEVMYADYGSDENDDEPSLPSTPSSETGFVLSHLPAQSSMLKTSTTIFDFAAYRQDKEEEEDAVDQTQDDEGPQSFNGPFGLGSMRHSASVLDFKSLNLD